MKKALLFLLLIGSCKHAHSTAPYEYAAFALVPAILSGLSLLGTYAITEDKITCIENQINQINSDCNMLASGIDTSSSTETKEQIKKVQGSIKHLQYDVVTITYLPKHRLKVKSALNICLVDSILCSFASGLCLGVGTLGLAYAIDKKFSPQR